MVNEAPGTADGVVVATGGAATGDAGSVWWALRPLISSNAATPAAATTGHQPRASRSTRMSTPPTGSNTLQIEQLELGEGGAHPRDPPNTVCSSSGAATSSWSYVHELGSPSGRHRTNDVAWRKRFRCSRSYSARTGARRGWPPRQVLLRVPRLAAPGMRRPAASSRSCLGPPLPRVPFDRVLAQRLSSSRNSLRRFAAKLEATPT